MPCSAHVVFLGVNSMHMQFSAVASLRTFVPWCALQGHDLPQSLCFLAWLFVDSQGLRGSSIFTLEPKDSNCVNSRQGSDSRGPHKTQWVSAFGFASPFGLKPAKWKMSRFNDHTVVRGSRPNLYHQYAAIKVLGCYVREAMVRRRVAILWESSMAMGRMKG